MKNWQRAMAVVFSTITFIPIAAISAQEAAVAAAGISTTAADTNAAEFPSGKGLQMVFRGERLETVLAHMSRAAGFVVYLRPGVRVDGTVDVWSEQPLSKEEAVSLLKTVLHDRGYSVIQQERTLTILRTEDMTTETPVRLGGDPAKISRSAEVVTQIIPVRTLNPVELVKLLTPLLPPRAILLHNESANSLLLTAAESDVHRVAEIIAALDSVSASANTLRIFPLQFADAKTLAGLIKELFAAPDTSSRNNGAAGRGNFIRFPGTRGAPGNAGLGSAGNVDPGETPVSRVAAVADEHGNAVIVSAPDGLLPAIEKLVLSVDVEIQDITGMDVFPLKNADPVEMANLISSLFPEQGNQADAGGARIQFGSQGARGAQRNGARQGNTAATGGPGEHMQKMGRVLAVPDSRTSSVIVCAAKSLLPEIGGLVAKLDLIDFNRQQLRTFSISYADPYEVQRMLQELYPSGTSSVANSGRTSMLIQRETTVGNNQMTSGAGSGMNNTSGAGGTSAGGYRGQ